ncbi:MAG TPA: S9 family peptidase [Candidatus Polarisedimenticolia bacterium]|jgi:dipeptidyl aminopeptidase/acylaminoacyl peptidase
MSIRVAARAAVIAILLAFIPLSPPPSTADWKWTAGKIVDYARVGSVEISPDGRRVAYLLSRPRGAEDKPGGAYVNLWVVAVEGGAPRRMTTADVEDKTPAWSPDGSAIAFLSARGDEKAKTRLWLMPAQGGEALPLTDEKTDVALFAWSPEGRRIAYVASDPKTEAQEKDEKAGRDWTNVDKDLKPRRLWIMEAGAGGSWSAPGVPRPVAAAGDRSIWEMDWSPDGSAVVATVSDTPRTDDSYMLKRVMVIPVADEAAAARELVPKVGKVDQVAWSRDGRTIAYRAGVDVHDSYSGSIFVVPAAGGRPVNLTGDAPESVNRIAWLPDGRLAAVAVRGTKTALAILEVPGPGRSRTVLAPGPLIFTSIALSKDGARFALAASTADGPAEVYVGEVGSKGGAEPRRVTAANPDLESLPRGRQEILTYKARDGLSLEAVLIRPAFYPGRSSYPLIVIPHGGPESQFLDGWNTGYAAPGQAFAERGWFVLYPNYRGSTGRGVAFAAADHGNLGGKEFTDVLDAIDALAGKYPIDLERVGITGGSYGGYFTALAVTRYSDRFAAGVELFGITNWMSFLGTSDTPVENSQVHWALWCYENALRCWEASPVRHVGAAATPTLIMQGALDERVPKPQSDELYAALRWKGVPVEYVVFPREKHGFRERAHQIETFERIMAWFERYLKP